MKKWKFFVAFLMLLCLTACEDGAAVNDRSSLAENMIHLYVVDENKVTRAENDYQLKTPDVIASCVEDIMKAIVELDASGIDSYSYMMGEDDSLQMDVTLKDGTYEQEDILLLMAATTKTLFQLQDITSIRLKIQSMENEVLVEQLFLRDSIYYYDCEESSLMEYDIKMYVPNSQEDALQYYGIKIQTEPQISDQEFIVRELVRKNVLPQGTKVNQVSVHDAVCYLDLSEEFENTSGTLTPELAVYALVNSVIAQTNVDTVQILVDGNVPSMYRNIVPLDHPLSFNSNVIEKE